MKIDSAVAERNGTAFTSYGSLRSPSSFDLPATPLQLFPLCPSSLSHKQLTFHLKSPAPAVSCAHDVVHTDIRTVTRSLKWIMTNPFKIAGPNTVEGSFFSLTFFFPHCIHLSHQTSFSNL